MFSCVTSSSVASSSISFSMQPSLSYDHMSLFASWATGVTETSKISSRLCHRVIRVRILDMNGQETSSGWIVSAWGFLEPPRKRVMKISEGSCAQPSGVRLEIAADGHHEQPYSIKHHPGHDNYDIAPQASSLAL